MSFHVCNLNRSHQLKLENLTYWLRSMNISCHCTWHVNFLIYLYTELSREVTWITQQ